MYDLVCGYIGQPLETIKIDSISKIIENHPYVEAARISKRYPSQIKIELIEREPIAMLNIKPMVFLIKIVLFYLMQFQDQILIYQF